MESSGVLAAVTDSNLWSGQVCVCVCATVGLAEQVICLSLPVTLCGASDRLRGVVHLAARRHVHPVNLAAIYQLPVHDFGVTLTHTVFGFVVAGVVGLEVAELTLFRR